MNENIRNEKTVATFDKSFWIYIIVFLITIGVICFFPYWFTNFSWFNFDFTETGQIGDTIGGIMTPFIAIAAAGLTFLAFWVQFKANEQQRQDIAKERFESKFYELLRMRRQNIEGVKIEDLEQREVFKELFHEFKMCFKILYNVFDTQQKITTNKSFYEQFNIAKKINLVYLIFFYGYKNIHSFTYEQTDVSDNEEWNKIKRELYDNFNENSRFWIKAPSSISMWNTKIKTSEGQLKLNDYLHSYYRPFQGQSQLLGHYYRNKYQTVKYIHEQNDKFLSFEKKYNYVKILRAQLSDYEQILFYYNTLSVLGYDWIDGGKDSLLVLYKMIKNIPLSLVVELKPDELFQYFEMSKEEIDLYFEHKNKLLEF